MNSVCSGNLRPASLESNEQDPPPQCLMTPGSSQRQKRGAGRVWGNSLQPLPLLPFLPTPGFFLIYSNPSPSPSLYLFAC